MIVNNAQGGDNLEIKVSKSLACIEWNKDTVVTWANQYAERYKGVEFSDETADAVKLVCQDLSAKHKRLEEIRMEQGRAFKAPLDQFYADIKEVQKVLSDVRDPLWESVKKYEEQQRQQRAIIVQQWIDTAAANAGLRHNYAVQITLLESWTIKSTTKPKVCAEIDARIATLLEMQTAADQAEELKRQRGEMAVMMCKLQSESAGLAKPIEPKDIYGIDNLSLMELPAAITAAVTKQRDAEQAAVERAERQKVEAAERESKRLADAEAARVKQAQQEEAAAAIAVVESGGVYVPKEKQFKLTVTVFGTENDCNQFLKIVDVNGYRYELGKMEEVQ